jgi:putative component of membrane protein insertase Oxa1/YidC/SpoIIIJ protein YidD
MNVFSKAAVNSITWYQTELSPKKGFCCAYRIKQKGLSCSFVVKQAFISRGFISGVHELFVQAARCRIAAIGLAEESRDSMPEETEQKNNDRSCESYIAEGICCYLPSSF